MRAVEGSQGPQCDAAGRVLGLLRQWWKAQYEPRAAHAAECHHRRMSVQTCKIVHPDIKPENPPERAAHYLDVPNMPWRTNGCLPNQLCIKTKEAAGG
jgi:hypothetical protein